MWNVVRAQMYQLKRDRITWGVLLFVLVLSGIFTFVSMDDFGEEISGSIVVASLGSIYCMVGMIVVLVIVANVIGKDFTDKTMNYEILSGHSRKEVFFGRFVVSLLVGVIGAFLVMVLLPVGMTIVFGWGDTINLSGVMARYGLILITLFRIVCELTFVTILTKNPYITYLVGFIFGYVQMIVSMLFPDWFADESSVLLSVGHCLDLLNFLDEYGQILYQSEVESSMVFLSIGTSLLAGVIIIMISYVFFQHNDLN